MSKRSRLEKRIEYRLGARCWHPAPVARRLADWLGRLPADDLVELAEEHDRRRRAALGEEP